MASNIQQSINQSLFAIGRVATIGKYMKGQKEQTKSINELIKKDMPTDKQIEEAEAKLEIANEEAQKEGFKDAQSRFDVQTEAIAAAEALKKKDPNFGFITKEGPEGALFGENPHDRFIVGKLEEGAWDSFVNRTSTLQNQKQSFADRKQFLENKKDPFQDELWQGGNV